MRARHSATAPRRPFVAALLVWGVSVASGACSTRTSYTYAPGHASWEGHDVEGILESSTERFGDDWLIGPPYSLIVRVASNRPATGSVTVTGWQLLDGSRVVASGATAVSAPLRPDTAGHGWARVVLHHLDLTHAPYTVRLVLRVTDGGSDRTGSVEIPLRPTFEQQRGNDAFDGCMGV